MEHNYAIENHTAERYLLEELPQDERDAYEEHFFSCGQCAEEVKAASAFIDSAREVIQEQFKKEISDATVKRTSIWGSWLNWRSIMQPLPAMACMLLVFVSGFSAYQNRVTIPELKASLVAAQSQGTETALVIPHESVVLGEARQGGEKLVQIPKGQAFSLQFDIPPQKFSSYEAWIATESGIKKLSLKPISAEQANNSVQIVVASGALPAGNYALVIQGVNSKGTESGVKGEPIHYPFQLKIQD